MFEIGSYVSYRADGVCKIVDIREESFGTLSSGALYYVLAPKNDEKSVFFVPLENEALLSVMRPILSADEIKELFFEVSKRDREWIDNAKSRGNFFKRILSTGDRTEIVYLLMILATYFEEKKTCATDEFARKRASQMLFDEFSMSMELASPNDILTLVESYIE